MSISGTYNFNPDVGEILEEAYERAGVDMRTSNHVTTALRSLNLLALEWQNKGINLWTVDEQTISSATITDGTAEYDLDINTIGIIHAVIRTGTSTNQSDLTIERMSATEYANITDKNTEGRPLQYWFRRVGVKSGTSGGTDVAPKIRFYPIPDKTNEYTFVYWRMRRIADMNGRIDNTVDVPDRFIPALISGLALKLYQKQPHETRDRAILQDLKETYAGDWMEAAEEDREKVDFRVVPDMRGYRIY